MSEDQLYSKFGREYPKDMVIFREGDQGQDMYVIQSGLVAISKKVGNVEKLLATLGPGEFFGEMAVISHKPRAATAVTLEATRCIVIDSKTLEAMIRGNVEIAVRMIKKLADRLQETDAQIENLLLPDINSRVVHYLAHVARTRGVSVAQGTKVEFVEPTLHGVLGCEEKQVREVLEKLSRVNLVIVEPDGVVVPDINSLQEFLNMLSVKKAKQP